MRRLHRRRLPKDQRRLLVRGSCAAASEAREHARTSHAQIPQRNSCATSQRNTSNLGSCADISHTGSSVRSPLRRLLNCRLPEPFTALLLAEDEKLWLQEVRNGATGARWPSVDSPYVLRSSTCGRGSSGYGCGHWGGSAHHGRAHHGSDPHERDPRGPRRAHRVRQGGSAHHGRAHHESRLRSS